MDSTRLAFFSDSSNQSLLIICKDSLRKDNLCIKAILRILTVPNLLVVTYDIGLEGAAWKIYHRCEIHIFLVEIFFVESLQSLFLNDQVVVIDVTIDTARSKACIILKPIDATNSVNVTFALIVLGTVFCVEIIYPDSISTIGASKKMTAVTELNFFASLDLKSSWL